ncbi:MAG: hypothetical protein H7145_06195 [Akkermansiaceae bacterium]|nr:hypothetical protein [Armatimonadota bacterium]
MDRRGLSGQRGPDGTVGVMEARLERALARWEAAGSERSDATADLLEARAALESAGAACVTDVDCALDQAAADLDILRRAYCAALHSHHCATMVLERTREAFRFAQERLDCIALTETQK